jgi:hypothetical protein
MRKAQTRVNLILKLFYYPSHTRSTRVKKKKRAVDVNNEKGRTSKEGFPSATRARSVARLHEEIGDHTLGSRVSEGKPRQRGAQ